MYENQPGGNKILFAKKENSKKEYLYNTFEFLELERNLMGIVDEEEMNPCIMGSPSTVDSTNLFQDINNNHKEQLSLKENKKELQQKFFISSVLRENWADYAARFKFNIFDTILREKKFLDKKANPGFKSN